MSRTVRFTEQDLGDAIAAFALVRPATPLAELLSRDRRITEGISSGACSPKASSSPLCELCGQGELWQGKRMALILDHVNGVADDNRLENLGIVCPNCAATLETHCGRKNRMPPRSYEVAEVEATSYVAVGRKYGVSDNAIRLMTESIGGPRNCPHSALWPNCGFPRACAALRWRPPCAPASSPPRRSRPASCPPRPRPPATRSCRSARSAAACSAPATR